MIIKAFTSEYFKELRILRKSKILFFNGCFDVLHRGHYDFLNKIKDLGNNNGYKIVCGLNSDKSVKLQNKSHPLINDEQSRAEMLKYLGIKNVIIFDEKTPLSVIMSLVPDVYYTTEEYKYSNADDILFCKNHDIRIEYAAKIPGYSTTDIYNKIYNIAKEELRSKLDEA